MTVSTIARARHRAAKRPSTPLTELASAASDQLGTVGRATAVVAASSGLVVSMMGAPAFAAPTDDTVTGALAAVDTDALTASAKAVLASGPVVSAPADAKWTIDSPVVKAVKPKPVVEKVVEAPVVQAPSVSRSTLRTADASDDNDDVANNPVPQSVSGNAVLEVAARYVGTPYVSGGSAPGGFDCSGFVSYVFKQLGISLPRTSGGIRAVGTVISRADAKPGDLIWTPGHIAIYAGGNQQIDSPRPGKTIQFRGIWQRSPVFLRVG
ncbi:C40 family peptidase [Cellulomonas rhizosphaerae]|uniref:Peptidoglycan endopeptidase n=1 Tax=Cellulomonas rhizosphaerae TaxID=2293719 RepID=A0A413RPV7_9CELL|nr:peptidoglycan endopeptidase [Cellulomonas rhizosphaerae]